MPKPTSSNAGEAGEYLVASDLLSRGLEVTKPLNRNGEDDLHVRLRFGWSNVQVKVAGKSRIDGAPSLMGIRRGDSRITSDIVALVNLKTKRIRYVANGPGLSLPKELSE